MERLMNIFFLDTCPVQSAKWQVDKHIVKMPLESAQMLCTAHRVLDGVESIELSKSNRKIKRWSMNDSFKNVTLYKANHVNHPSAAWVRASYLNYMWLYEHFLALSVEYKSRYGKSHKSFLDLRDVLSEAPANIPLWKSFSAPPPAMPDEYITEDVVTSYRNYYRYAKSDLHAWKQNKPVWI
jgi:hypothetical protein